MNKNVSDELLQQIRSCTNLVHRLINSERHLLNPAFHKKTVGRGQGLVLHILSENDGLAQTELTERLDIRPSSLGELVAKLEKNGYVVRRQNENDKRIINVFLTEKGREIESEYINLRQQAAESWCAGLAEEEEAQLSKLLDKLIRSMEDALSKNVEEFSKREFPFEDGSKGMDRNRFLHGGPHYSNDPFER